MFIESFAPPPRMVIFGAVDFTAALVRIAKVLGYRVTVCDARPAFATAARFPQADEVVVDWPDRHLAKVGASSGRATRCACSPTTPSSTCPPSSPPCARAAATSAPWARAAPTPIGSSACGRRGSPTTDWRGSWAPIGLDIGARTPEETAVSICAEIIALRTGRRAPRRSATPTAPSTPRKACRCVTQFTRGGRGASAEGDCRRDARAPGRPARRRPHLRRRNGRRWSTVCAGTAPRGGSRSTSSPIGRARSMRPAPAAELVEVLADLPEPRAAARRPMPPAVRRQTTSLGRRHHGRRPQQGSLAAGRAR